ncbi:hypothetical protein [Aliarcobacter butzleri]|uniref:Uncharacterized protein n=1 Tax=Aliarcobacter butzleri TaxID=28197 RepID=A0AAW6VIM6_9BACT|nr:hypothetical protein [Aliarcobacter butzleri]MDK2042515.1 hypothetical protein [Aliarcobacter butzleri]MDK2097021.1 hypothetical protein [Aliarcobacter butzleri]
MNINEIIEKIKDILSNELNNKRVFDKDVAAALNLSKQSLSILKKKNSIPYEEIAKFCAIGYLGTFGKNATKNFKLTLKSDTLLYEPLELIFP